MSEQPEKLDLTSMDVTEDKKQKLKQLFPEVFREDKIDFEHLKRVLGEWVPEKGRERFGLQWPGKAECMKIIQQPSIATLTPDRKESINFDETENLFIEGENLETLKLLQKSYFGEVKMIYIDPPYNTGKEFLYPDNYGESLETYLQFSNQKNDEGEWQTTNRDTDGRFHSRWLNMMYPRLFLAKNLLKDDGLIFISIDDGEFANLKKLCDEIFGEENFVDNIIWKKRYGGGAKEKYLVTLHEYILVYAKNIDDVDKIEVPLDEESINRYYKSKDSNYEERGPYRTHPLEATKSVGRREKLVYPIPGPDGEEIWPERQWWWKESRALEALENGELEYVEKSDGSYTVYTKQYLKNEDGEMRKTKPFSIIDDIYTQHGTSEIEEIFGDSRIFTFPKPSELIKKLLEIADIGDGDIVLDFFAASATTAQSVFQYNVEYDKNGKFLLVQIPEAIDEEEDAYKEGYETIADIGKDRIRKVIQGYKEEKKSRSSQTELELEEEPDREEELDLGFKVYKLDRSNFKVWDSPEVDIDPEDLEEQLNVFADHITPEAEQESILHELILKSGYPLTTSVEEKEIEGKTIYSIQSDALLIYLDDDLTFEILDQMAEMEPNRVVCLDKSFSGEQADALKTNAVQLFKSHDIAFRTV